MSDDLPLTRWELGSTTGYARRFADLIADGKDVVGEARLADTLVRRGARVLDAGSGMGRIGAALRASGHEVVAVEKDPELVAESRRRYPDLPVTESDLLALTPAELGAFDLVVLVGNVIVLLAPDTEQRLLVTLRDLLAPGGRILVGFHPYGGHGSARDYPYDAFAADVRASGLAVQHRFGSYELAAPSEEYVVAVLVREPAA